MPPAGRMPHSKLPPDAVIHPRSQDTRLIRTEDVEEISPAYIAESVKHLQEALGDIARRAENRAHPVDEYNTASLGVGQATTAIVSLNPTYEYMPEKILSILVGGPAAANVTLVLGDRNLPITIPAAGIIPIGPLGLILGRNDPRQLIAVTPGTYFLELMGWADSRFNI